MEFSDEKATHCANLTANGTVQVASLFANQMWRHHKVAAESGPTKGWKQEVAPPMGGSGKWPHHEVAAKCPHIGIGRWSSPMSRQARKRLFFRANP